MAKYDPLGQYLTNLPPTTIRKTLTFEQIENIISQKMENAARQNVTAWDNRHGTTANVRQNSWLDAGWEVKMIDMENEVVRFHRRNKNET